MSFDRLAPHYTWMEAVLAGPRLQRCRVAWIDALADCTDVLIAGVGHGHFLKWCVQRFPAARFTCVDASASMLRHAERRARAAGARPGAVTLVHATLPEWPAPAGFDAIVTHFFLDCFAPDQLGAVVASLGRAARPRACWLLSDFAVPPRGLAHRRAKLVHAMMYAFFRRVTRLPARRLTDPDPLITAAGFTREGRRTAEWGLLRADLWRRHATE